MSEDAIEQPAQTSQEGTADLAAPTEGDVLPETLTETAPAPPPVEPVAAAIVVADVVEQPVDTVTEAPVAAPPSTETIPCPLTLEQYFRSELSTIKSGEFRVVAEFTAAGDVKFYIHPLGRNGLSRDFTVMGELVRNVTRLLA